MSDILDVKVNEFMAKVIAKNPGESEFHQAVKEVVESLMPFIEENPKYKQFKVLERMVEPERVIISVYLGSMTTVKSKSTVVSASR
jgi:hypothetical protein